MTGAPTNRILLTCSAPAGQLRPPGDHHLYRRTTLSYPDRLRSQLADFPIVMPNAVDWADMDAFRHVNNTVFFRYFENARIQYLGAIAFGDEREDGLGPILHSTAARFRRPLQFPDTAWTGARVTRLDADRFEMAYRIVSEREGEVAAEGTAIVVCFDYHAGAKAPIPSDVRAAIERVGDLAE